MHYLSLIGLIFFYFSYLTVTCVVVQKNGAGVHTVSIGYRLDICGFYANLIFFIFILPVQASSCFWDNGTDGSCTVRWENKTMYCIVSVFGLAI